MPWVCSLRKIPLPALPAKSPGNFATAATGLRTTVPVPFVLILIEPWEACPLLPTNLLTFPLYFLSTAGTNLHLTALQRSDP